VQLVTAPGHKRPLGPLAADEYDVGALSL